MHMLSSTIFLHLILSLSLLNGILGSFLPKLLDDLTGSSERGSQLLRLGIEILIPTSSSSGSSSSSSSSGSSSRSSYSSGSSTTSSSIPARVSYPSYSSSSSSRPFLSAKELSPDVVMVAATLSLFSYHDCSLKEETAGILESYCKGTNKEVSCRVSGSTIRHVYDEKGVHIGLILSQPKSRTWIALAGTQDLEGIWTSTKGVLTSFVGKQDATIHTGYMERAQQIAGLIGKMLKRDDFENEVIMCGHSSGGALCLLVTMMIEGLSGISQSNMNNRLKWITFGMPAFIDPSSDWALLTGYNSRNHLRVCSNDDPVVMEGMLGKTFKHGDSLPLVLDSDQVSIGNEYVGTKSDFPLTMIISMKGVQRSKLRKEISKASSSTSTSGSSDAFLDAIKGGLGVMGMDPTIAIKNFKNNHGIFGYVYAVMELRDRKTK